MVSEDSEVVDSREKNATLFDSPSDSKKFEFDNDVSTLCFHKEPGSCLYSLPFLICILGSLEEDESNS